MPAYDYQCEKCLTAFEIHASFVAYERGLEVKCPRCGSRRVRRAINSVAFIGSGKTDAGNPPRGCAPGAGRGCCG